MCSSTVIKVLPLDKSFFSSGIDSGDTTGHEKRPTFIPLFLKWLEHSIASPNIDPHDKIFISDNFWCSIILPFVAIFLLYKSGSPPLASLRYFGLLFLTILLKQNSSSNLSAGT